MALCANLIAPHSPIEQFRDATLAPPAWQAGGSAKFLLGTDAVGRDMLSRLIHGARLSLLIGLVSVSLSLSLGVALGLMAGYFRGLTEIAIMRLMDVMLALPSLLLAIAIVAILGPGLINAMYAIAIVMLPHYVRLTRAAVIGEMAKDYVSASRIAGAGTLRLMFDTRAAQLRRAADRAGHARFFERDPRCRRARLPRPRRAAADAGMGLDAGRARSNSSRAHGGS